MRYCSNLLKEPPGWFIHVVLITNQFIWSGMHVISHPALEYFPPHVFAALRMTIGVPFISLLARRETEFWLKVNWRKDVLWMIPLGIFGVAFPQWLVFVGNDMAGASITASFAPMVPVNTAVMAGLLGQEVVSRFTVAGIAVAVIGTFSILRVESLDVSSDRTGGILVLIFQSWTYASYLVALKHLTKLLPHPVGIFFMGSVFGCIFLLLISTPQFVAIDWTEVPASVWTAEVYCGFLSSFLAHVMNSWAVHHCTPTIPALYGCLQPVIGVVMAVILLGENFGLRDGFSVAMIISGLVIVTQRRSSTKQGSVNAQLPQTNVFATSSQALHTIGLEHDHNDEDQDHEQGTRFVDAREIELETFEDDSKVGLLSARAEGYSDQSEMGKVREERLAGLLAASTTQTVSSGRSRSDSDKDTMSTPCCGPRTDVSLAQKSIQMGSERSSNAPSAHKETVVSKSDSSDGDMFYDCHRGGSSMASSSCSDIGDEIQLLRAHS